MVGKSSILMRYTDDLFSQSYIMSIGVDFKYKTVEINGKRLRLQIWDTAGQDRFRTITAAYYRGAEGIIIVYSVDSNESFQNTHSWLADMNKHVEQKIPVALVGNKCDLVSERQVTSDMGRKYAEEHNCLYFETSAKTGNGINQLFTSIASEILRHKEEPVAATEFTRPSAATQNEKSGHSTTTQVSDTKPKGKCCGH
ncbi:putative GTP-binding protein ypt2 [Blattamonas nauphoetae]|uniref:GTP-binding protein ypt2 n=1 Tax=Blattamonas nauphoetae TaxID=2049346 RepID=A0ABQ9YIW6_9EUKA|nr:putative GTP-binding protein ypt2 [Blattamonas nauphoetae]